MIVELDKYLISNTLFDANDIECDYCKKLTRGRCYTISSRDESSSIGMPTYITVVLCKKCGVRADLHTKDIKLITKGMSLFKMKGLL